MLTGTIPSASYTHISQVQCDTTWFDSAVLRQPAGGQDECCRGCSAHFSPVQCFKAVHVKIMVGQVRGGRARVRRISVIMNRNASSHVDLGCLHSRQAGHVQHLTHTVWCWYTTPAVCCCNILLCNQTIQSCIWRTTLQTIHQWGHLTLFAGAPAATYCPVNTYIDAVLCMQTSLMDIVMNCLNTHIAMNVVDWVCCECP